MNWQLVVGALIGLAGVAGAREIGFIESFSLADDRGAALAELVPGTDEYFYYHALHAQNEGRGAEFNDLLERWKRERDGNVVPGARELLNRQALLDYAAQPRATLDYLVRELDLHFDHARQTGQRSADAPSRLDPDLISVEAFRQRALARTRNSIDRVEDAGLESVAGLDLNADQRRSLLARLQQPDYPRLLDHILADLDHQGSRGFGHHPIHGQLTLAQLDELMQRRPALRNEAGFVTTYLAKLAPPDEVDLDTDPVAREDYYDRVWAFVETLDPVHNSLKANVLYNRLVHDERAGLRDPDRFLAYLQLPRNVPYLPRAVREALPRQDHLAELGVDFNLVALPPIQHEQPLVERLLHHFLREAADYQAYTRWLRDDFLKRVFAETKIVHGIGDPERWAALLTPDEYRQLKERVDIDFAPENPEVFAADAPVALRASVKHVSTLLVKVYEINTVNYLRETGQPLNLAINLDGLVASTSRTETYGEPPERRVERTYAFPELDRRGTYVVELIGNGKSSRALVQKGRLGVLQEVTPAGHAFTVYDEALRRLPDAHGWLAGRRFDPGPDGRILVPFSTAPGTESLVVQHGDFASLVRFDHLGEVYTLDAGIYVDREALLRREKAEVVIRPTLRIHGIPTSLSLIEEPRLTIASTDLQGIRTEKEFAGLALREDRELTKTITVPENTVALWVRLVGRVENISLNEKQDLAVERSFALNGIDRSPAVHDLHVTRTADGHAIELRGRNGEPRPGEPLSCFFKHRFFRDEIRVDLQTDANGRAALGELAGIERFRVREPQGVEHTWAPPENRCAYPAVLHGRAGETLRVALATDDEPAALFEIRRGQIARDLSDALAAHDGFLELRGLAAGDYQLHLKRAGVAIPVRVTDGERGDGFVLSARRALEEPRLAPLQVTRLEADAGELRIQVAHASPFTRVHVIASRYLPEYDLFDGLAPGAPAPLLHQPWRPARSFYESGRDIGDEYRYILDRQRAAGFPGNMLERPGLLLNPWALRDTEAAPEVLAAETAYAGANDEPADAARALRSRAGRPADDQRGFADLDFLRHPAAVLLNLVPDEDGRIAIPRDQLRGNPHLRVLATDPTTAVLRHLFLEDSPVPTRDLRLAGGLDPQSTFSEQKLVTPVPAGNVLDIADVSSAAFQTYGTVADAYRLLATLGGNPTFQEFSFVTRWPSLDPAEQRRLYAKYACHELNFFLYHKDPAFFREVIQPYLSNKMDKTFLDVWLTGGALADYLDPWRFARLNTVERILLGRRLREQQASIVRDTRERADLIPPNIEDFNRRFDTAVQTGAMEAPTEGVALAVTQAVRSELARKQVERFGAVVADSDGNGILPPMAAPAAGRMAGLAERLGEEGAVDHPAMRADKSEMARPEELGLNYFWAAGDRGRETSRRFFQRLDQTKEWAENNYYHLPIEEQVGGLVAVNAFWADYAAHDGPGPFLSPSFPLATSNFTEMMLALSVLDLPFEAAEHAEQLDGLRYTVTAASPVVVFHREIRPAARAERAGPVLVAQHFFRADDRYRHEGNERYDKYVTDEFLAHVVYGAQVVLTNPTGNRQKIQALLQIPAGAIPVNGGFYTRGVYLTLEPYSTQTQEYFFYFPDTGRFAHYPVTVSDREVVVGAADPFTFPVVEQLSVVDKTSWPWISQNGSLDEVLAFLDQANLHRVDLEQIAWRMQDGAAFRETVDRLNRRHVYHHTLWSYGLRHNEADAIGVYLRHSPFADQCGLYLDSALLRLDPVERFAYQHLEYAPLVNARVHPVGARRKILNNRFREQYQALMKVLSYKRALTDADELAAAYYLVLQDRIEEAIAWFGRVDRQAIAAHLQADYLEAYLAMYQGEVERARTLAARHAEHGVDRWRNRFAALLGQLDELAGGAARAVDETSRDQAQGVLAATEPALEMRVEAGQIRLDYRNLDRCTLNFYPMDIELLFSRSPFLQEGATQFSFIRPVLSLPVNLPAGQDAHTVEVPAEFRARNVMVEAVGAGQRRAQAYYANTLRVQLIEAYGQLVVTQAETRQPVPAVYVKVYARMNGGEVKFFKDGYTDLRGRFDYVSLNTNELEDVERFALLILSRDLGAVVRETPPPKR